MALTKGIATRQNILDTALDLFSKRGFEETTLRELASRSGVSLGLSYRYFKTKEAIVLAYYEQLSDEHIAELKSLPKTSLNDRFAKAMKLKIESLEPNRSVLLSLFPKMMDTRSKISVLGPQTKRLRIDTRKAYDELIRDSKNPIRGKSAQCLSALLFGLQMLLILFWMYDRSDQRRTTFRLIEINRKILGMIFPFLGVPPFKSIFLSLGEILDSVFFGDCDEKR